VRSNEEIKQRLRLLELEVQQYQKELDILGMSAEFTRQQTEQKEYYQKVILNRNVKIRELKWVLS